MWNDEPLIFDDEDEEALKTKYVNLKHRYKNKYSDIEIADEVFRGLRDPLLRGRQAIAIWSRNLELQERIRMLDLFGENHKIIKSEEEYQAAVLATIQDDSLSSQEKKVRIDGYRLLGEANSWIKKAVDKTINDKRTNRRGIIFAMREDDEVAGNA